MDKLTMTMWMLLRRANLKGSWIRIGIIVLVGISIAIAATVVPNRRYAKMSCAFHDAEYTITISDGDGKRLSGVAVLVAALSRWFLRA